MDIENGGSPYRLKHSEGFVGFTDLGVDFVVRVAGCCHFVAQTGKFFNVF